MKQIYDEVLYIFASSDYIYSCLKVGGTLIILEAKVSDSGKYLCMVNNSVGGESVETVLTVTGRIFGYPGTRIKLLCKTLVQIVHNILFFRGNFGTSALNPGAGFLRIFTVAFERLG